MLFFSIGCELGRVLEPKLPEDYQSSAVLACASEDADWLANDELNGREIVPGIGGMVYDRLGLGGEAKKNQYIPHLVRERMDN